MTQGWNESYPSTLSGLIQENIIDEISFENVVDSEYEYLIEEGSYSVNLPEVVNMGVVSETSITIAGRAGAIPYVTSEDIVIPDQASEVELSFVSASGKK